MAVQRTLVLVKPDGVRRRLVGEIVRRLETRGFDIAGMKLMTVDDELAKRHYEEHLSKPFFPELLAFITSGPVVAMAVEGEEAVATIRTMMGATNPLNAAPGTIRGDYGLLTTENLVHGSDSPESAARELGLFFPELQ